MKRKRKIKNIYKKKKRKKRPFFFLKKKVQWLIAFGILASQVE
jgi:hypothetical protein